VKTATKHRLIRFEDLIAKIRSGKFGECMYKSPYYGYKRGYKYNQLVYIYLADNYPDKGWLDTHLFESSTRREIINYLAEFKKSRRYLKAVSK